MCIMEIHAGAAKATMLQAIWHNTVTVVTDCVMLESILRERGDTGGADLVNMACENLKRSASLSLAEFKRAAESVAVHELADHDHYGHERSISDIERSAGRDAEKEYARPNIQDRGIWQ